VSLTWGQGLSRRLIDNFMSELLPGGFKQAVLWVLRDNFRARRFYEIAGWRADGGSKDHFGGHHAMAVRYRFKPERLKVVTAIPSDAGGG
jgi:GNAT superfamily N-acetyltransferase